MSRTLWFHDPVSRFLFISVLVLSLLASISLPGLPWAYIARTHLDGAVVLTTGGVSEIRFGIWGVCYYDSKERTCRKINNVPIKQGNDVAFVNWEKQKNELIVQPTVTILSIVAIFLTVSLITIWSTDLCNSPYMNARQGKLEVYDFMRSIAYYLVMFVMTVALVESVILNFSLYNLIESKLHKLGPTSHGPGLIFILVSLVVLGFLCIAHSILFLRDRKKPRRRVYGGIITSNQDVPVVMNNLQGGSRALSPLMVINKYN